MTNDGTPRDWAGLLLLSAVWGLSFLFLRVAAPAMAPAFLVEMRVLSALAVMLPMCLIMGRHAEMLRHWRMILVAGLANMALPFCLFSWAALHTGAGALSILNATVPFFTALVALAWFGQRLSRAAAAGLAAGFAGVALLGFDPSWTAAGGVVPWAMGAALLACALYGFALNLVARRLSGVSGLAITTGGLICSALLLLPAALWTRPAAMPPAPAWLSVTALGVLCTGGGFLLFYRLVARIGPSNAVMTTYLIPVFSILWGSLLLGEDVTAHMAAGCALVLLGVGLTTGGIRTGARGRG